MQLAWQLTWQLTDIWVVAWRDENGLVAWWPGSWREEGRHGDSSINHHSSVSILYLSLSIPLSPDLSPSPSLPLSWLLISSATHTHLLSLPLSVSSLSLSHVSALSSSCLLSSSFLPPPFPTILHTKHCILEEHTAHTHYMGQEQLLKQFNFLFVSFPLHACL